MQSPPLAFQPTAQEIFPDKPAHLSQPFVQIEGILNCRYVPLPSVARRTDTASAATTPWLFRAGDISRLTPRGIDDLHALDIRTIFDLRSDGSDRGVVAVHTGTLVIEGVEIMQVPMLPDPAPGNGEQDWYGDENLRKVYAEYREDEQGAFMRTYTRFLEAGKGGIEVILRRLIERKTDDGGVLFHCNGGKDRTGVLAALLLELAGQEDSAIVDDYALTAAGLEPFAGVLLKRFETSAAFQENTEGAMNVFSSRPETMRNFLELMRTKYGGAEGYARNIIGLSQTEVDILKNNLRVGA